MNQPPPKFYKVRRPDTGQIGEVEEKDIDQAIALGGEVIDDFNNPPPSSVENTPPNQEKMFKVRRPDTGEIGEVSQSNLQKAKELGGKVIEEDPTYNDVERLAARSAKTIGAAATGGLVDTITSIYNIPAAIENAKTPDMKANSTSSFVPESFVPEPSPYPEAELPLIPSAEHAIENKIDEATGGYTKTHEGDSLQTGLKMASTIATPAGLAKGASKVGLEGAAKVLGALGTTKPTGIASAGATGVGQSEAEKSGYGGAASAAIGLGAGAATGIASSLRRENVKLALATLTGNSPKNINLKALDATESLGLDYQNTLVNESKGLAIADQFVSKAPFTGSLESAKNKKINDAFAKAVEQSIDKVGQKIIDSDSPLDTGTMLQDVFIDLKEGVKEKKNHLYESASSLLPQDAEIFPKNLLHAVEDVRRKITTLRASPDQSFVLKYLDEIENGILSGSKEAKTLAPIPMDVLQGSKVSINDIINWDVNASGAKNHLKQLQHAIKEDLEAYGKKNKPWFDKFKEAEEYYGKYLGDEALGSDVVRKKIFSQKDPEKIINSLSNISDFKALEQSLGAQGKGETFFNSIKREKLADLFMGKIIDPKTDAVTYINFSKVLESPQNKELVKYLAGENYADLQNFSKYAKANVERSRRVPNPSGTAPTMKFLNHLEALGTGLVGSAFGIGGLGLASGAAGTLALTTAASSWLVNNKTALKWGIEAAKKQAQGKIKEAATLSNRIERSMTQDMGEDFVRQFLALSSQD